MYAIRLSSGDLLDLPVGFNLSFELNNQVFTTSDTSVLPGSFSFPADLPLTAKNRVLLGQPALVQNAKPWKRIPGIWVYCHGIPFFPGDLVIMSATRDKVRVSIITTPMRPLSELPLNKLDLGGARNIGDKPTMILHANGTAANPLDYDYVFFPILNRDFIEDKAGLTDNWSSFQNYFDANFGAFQVEHEHPLFMPFVRLEYLLKQIFAATDYAFQNQFQVNEELRRICLYNNVSMWTKDGLPSFINLQRHVSKTTCTAFIKKIMGAFCLGLFTNVFTKSIRLVPLAAVAQRPAAHDWTRYAIGSHEVSSSEGAPARIAWKVDDKDMAFKYYGQFVKPDPADVLGEIYSYEMATIGPSAPGIYWIIDRHAYYTVGVFSYFFEWGTLGSAPDESSDPVFEAECQALWDVHMDKEGSYAIGQATRYNKLPRIDTQGTVEYERTLPGSSAEVITQSADVPDRLTIYRGFYENLDGDDYPFACGLPYDDGGNLIGNYSLRWDGKKGMYAQWWQRWHQMILHGKPVTQSFALPIADLIAFSFEDKMHFAGMDYFVKKLSVKQPLSRNRVLVEASLVSTI